MTETEISELRQAVLKLWEGSEYLILRDGLQEKILTLKRELAENSFYSLGGIPSFETIKQNAWLAFLEGHAENGFWCNEDSRDTLDKSKETAVIALDTYLETLENVNLDSGKGKSFSPKIQWEGSIRQLIYLFREMSKIGLIPDVNLPSMISNHFCKKDRIEINRDNLSKQIYQLDTLQDGRPKDEDAQAIDDILNTLQED
jgi:hypothetical protein